MPSTKEMVTLMIGNEATRKISVLPLSDDNRTL